MELDHLGTSEELRGVAGWDVVRITLVGLGVAVGVRECDLAVLDVAPVRALSLGASRYLMSDIRSTGGRSAD
jgi:hypothetical protein